ncbi:hypothetical protein WH95_02240 [Kiloniella litopenaei]|uniref:Uncharacterized protein n=1 Tax=Kiloniella litopenaei TaxID=1549748 RepID=A0A0M2RF52_9PROT|nr:YeeE/YedE family protein [Kiloniella litopenaei]KKJ78183.1 hypothetical protein WH95_02240 [Kiloniella litopenaei]
MENFTPVSALIGGGLIGSAAVILMLFNGRIAGISGILGGCFSSKTGDIPWRIAFVAGLVLSPLLYGLFRDENLEITFSTSTPLLIIGGLLVGVGTQLGSGCTSGHGVCGISRLSLRSITATLIFMVTAGVTVFLFRHVLGG